MKVYNPSYEWLVNLGVNVPAPKSQDKNYVDIDPLRTDRNETCKDLYDGLSEAIHQEVTVHTPDPDEYMGGHDGGEYYWDDPVEHIWLIGDLKFLSHDVYMKVYGYEFVQNIRQRNGRVNAPQYSEEQLFVGLKYGDDHADWYTLENLHREIVDNKKMLTMFEDEHRYRKRLGTDSDIVDVLNI